MMSSSKSVVTLLHKGQGPSLFLNRSTMEFPVHYNQSLKDNGPSSAIVSPRSTHTRTRRLPSPPPTTKPPAKRIVVKCVDRQDANTMFTKRLRERAALRSSRPSSSTGLNPKTPVQVQQCEMFLKERLFTNRQYKPTSFPPPSFMPRWNPRRMDKTYMSKMVLEDPWSLPPDKRTELKKRTGLRLKSLSRHYQYKVGASLPYGKDADSTKCTCFVQFCDHCTKAHDYRCPLHMQLLDDFEPDCKVEAPDFCPFSTNVEDLPLNRIEDAGVYVTEVVRRLRAGEISEAPPFPKKFLRDKQKTAKGNQKNIPASAEASTDALDHQKKAIVEETCTQTEPFIVDMDMKAAFKENICQTKKPEKDEPLMRNLLLATEGQSPYKHFFRNKEADTQVTPCMLETFNLKSSKVVRSLTKQTLQQAIQEVTNEVRLGEIQEEKAIWVQRLLDLQRTAQFKYLQEKWRTNAYYDEQYIIEQEMLQEMNGEEGLCVIAFAQSLFHNFPAKVMDSLRQDGFIVNEDLKAMNTLLRDHMNKLAEIKLRRRDDSLQLLDEIINHAILDVEMDAFRGRLVDEKYLNPLIWSTRSLREMIDLQDDNIDMIKRIKERLISEGWLINDQGVLVDGATMESSSDLDLSAFLKGVRVSVDKDGSPKYLVDSKGKPLPINLKWLPVLEKKMEEHMKDRNKTKSSWKFNIILSEEGLRAGDGASGGVEGEKEGEGLGLDLDYLGSEIADDDDDEDHGRLVFKTKDHHKFGEDDDEDNNM